MDEIKTWADFWALPEEDRSSLTPEEVETLKTTIMDNEAKAAKEREDELAKAKELAENYKIRAEKAEKSKKETKTDDKPSYSIQDIKALADVPDEDIEELTNFAKFKNVPIHEAKKSPVMQTYLKEKAEERRTAEAANIRGGRPSSQVTGETLLEKAKQGQVPEKDEDLDKLVEARMQAKLKK